MIIYDKILSHKMRSSSITINSSILITFMMLLIQTDQSITYGQDLFSSVPEDIFLEPEEGINTNVYKDTFDTFTLNYKDPWRIMDLEENTKNNPFSEYDEDSDLLHSIIFQRPSAAGDAFMNIAILDKATFKIKTNMTLEKLAPKILNIIQPEMNNFAMFSNFNYTAYKIGTNNTAISFVSTGDPKEIFSSDYAILTVASIFKEKIVIAIYYSPQTEYEKFIKDFEFTLSSFRFLDPI